MGEFDDLLAMSDAALRRRIMVLLKRSCDNSGTPYPPKLVAYLEAAAEKRRASE